MMNKYYHSGLLVETNMKYLRIDVGSDIEYVENPTLSLLYIKVPKGSKNSDVIVPGCTVIEDQEVTSLKPTKIEFKEYNFNGLIIKPRVHNYIFNQVLTDELNIFTVYDSRRCNIYLNPNLDKVDYISHISQIPYFDIIDSSNFDYRNFYNCMMRRGNDFSNSNDTKYKSKSNFTKYILNEPHVIYQLNNAILDALQPYDILNLEKSGEPDEEYKNNSSALSYRIGNESMIKNHIHPNAHLDHIIQVELPMEYQIKTQSISVAMDIRNKFMNLNLISNITSLVIKDAKGNDHRVCIWWDPQMSDLGDRESTMDDFGSYAHILNIRCTVHYFIVMDIEEYAIISKVEGVFNIIEKLEKQGIQVTSGNIRPLSVKEVEDIIRNTK